MTQARSTVSLSFLRLTAANADIDICLLERKRGGNPDSGRWDGPPGAA